MKFMQARRSKFKGKSKNLPADCDQRRFILRKKSAIAQNLQRRRTKVTNFDVEKQTPLELTKEISAEQLENFRDNSHTVGV